MAIRALLSKKLGRPRDNALTRIQKYSIGTACPTFQGHAKLGFRKDGKLLAADLYVARRVRGSSGGGFLRWAELTAIRIPKTWAGFYFEKVADPESWGFRTGQRRCCHRRHERHD
jgi:CO/xanthine dehydrogenase Mo-binding subunit